jgi:hypothetical protein
MLHRECMRVFMCTNIWILSYCVHVRARSSDVFDGLCCKQEEAEKFEEIHRDFGVLAYYDEQKLQGRGALHLPGSLI